MTRPIDIESLVLKYNASNSRLLLIDYDGTLVPLEENPQAVRLDDDGRDILKRASNDGKNQVVLISGRDREFLDRSIGDLPIVLVAEHGAFYREPGANWNEMFIASNEWINTALPAFKALAFHYEGSLLEIKDYSLAWHYRKISTKVTKSDKKQILAAIRSLPVHNYFQIYDSEFTIELRTPKINKGSFVAQWMGTRKFDFVLAIGDGKTDEDLFKMLGDQSYTIKIGPSSASHAAFHLNSQMDVIPFVHSLLLVNNDFERMKSRVKKSTSTVG